MLQLRDIRFPVKFDQDQVEAPAALNAKTVAVIRRPSGIRIPLECRIELDDAADRDEFVEADSQPEFQRAAQRQPGRGVGEGRRQVAGFLEVFSHQGLSAVEGVGDLQTEEERAAHIEVHWDRADRRRERKGDGLAGLAGESKDQLMARPLPLAGLLVVIIFEAVIHREAHRGLVVRHGDDAVFIGLVRKNVNAVLGVPFVEGVLLLLRVVGILLLELLPFCGVSFCFQIRALLSIVALCGLRVLRAAGALELVQIILDLFRGLLVIFETHAHDAGPLALFGFVRVFVLLLPDQLAGVRAGGVFSEGGHVADIFRKAHILGNVEIDVLSHTLALRHKEGQTAVQCREEFFRQVPLPVASDDLLFFVGGHLQIELVARHQAAGRHRRGVIAAVRAFGLGLINPLLGIALVVEPQLHRADALAVGLHLKAEHDAVALHQLHPVARGVTRRILRVREGKADDIGRIRRADGDIEGAGQVVHLFGVDAVALRAAQIYRAAEKLLRRNVDGAGGGIVLPDAHAALSLLARRAQRHIAHLPDAGVLQQHGDGVALLRHHTVQRKAAILIRRAHRAHQAAAVGAARDPVAAGRNRHADGRHILQVLRAVA